ncbi:lipopolysaccharide heptosyltransferase I [Sphaerotilus sp.]|uniref:lipopolysaccharide heptosyltransferase I n=1 Tax=Sphaerotilus sp. TaxID=2093942 RepID=UPI0034E2463F
MRRVLLVKLSSLGDVIHAMPVVADLRAAFPEVCIDWVVEPGFAPLVRRVEGIGEVIECAQRRWRKRWWTGDVQRERQAFRARLRQQHYDAVLDLQGLTKSALVARQARMAPGGLRYALGNRTDGSGWEAPTRWLADRAVTLEPHLHVVDRSRRMAAEALGYAVSGPPRFGVVGHMAPPLQARTLVFVHGTSRDDKLWPEALWIAFGQSLVRRGWRMAMPQASDEEAQRAGRIAAGIGPTFCDLWPRMGLDALVDQMGRTQGVVGVDSGLSHLAVALDLPHVQLYNFPTAWRTGPLPEHGHAHQVCVGGDGIPALEAVEAAWQRVAVACGVVP